jgi:cephalosporin hydroxylase
MGKIELEMEYRIVKDTVSDINEHIEILKLLSDEVEHVTEMGTRTGSSTRAFLVSDVKFRSYDLFLDDRVSELFTIAKQMGKDVEYIKANVLELEIEKTDFLFIDTWHSYDQLIEELRLHAPKVKKYIAFHDTQTFGTKSETFMGKTGSNGLLPAIIHYMIESGDQWKFKMHRTNNNGLTVIERRTPLDVLSKFSYNT